jgi:hypothetical protein
VQLTPLFHALKFAKVQANSADFVEKLLCVQGDCGLANAFKFSTRIKENWMERK